MLPTSMRNDDQHQHRLHAGKPGDDGRSPDQVEDGDRGENDVEFLEDEALQEALSSYGSESLAWAERCSATMPVPQTSGFGSWWQRVPGTALAAAALAMLVSAATIRHHQVLGTARETANFVQPSSETLESDNRLLSSVDAALQQDSVPTEEDLGLADRSLRIPVTRPAFRTGTIGDAR